MQGAEERRLRRLSQYVASLPRRRPGEERAKATPLAQIPPRRGDDAPPVIWENSCFDREAKII
jgi:hypothetical protein